MPNQDIQEPTMIQENVDGNGGEGMDPSSLQGNSSDSQGRGLDFLLDLPLQVSVELGRTTMVVNDILQLAQGSIVELEKAAGEALEILVNGKLIARGEVVAINEKFGIRVTEILSPTKRIEQLG